METKTSISQGNYTFTIAQAKPVQPVKTAEPKTRKMPLLLAFVLLAVIVATLPAYLGAFIGKAFAKDNGYSEMYAKGFLVDTYAKPALLPVGFKITDGKTNAKGIYRDLAKPYRNTLTGIATEVLYVPNFLGFVPIFVALIVILVSLFYLRIIAFRMAWRLGGKLFKL